MPHNVDFVHCVWGRPGPKFRNCPNDKMCCTWLQHFYNFAIVDQNTSKTVCIVAVTGLVLVDKVHACLLSGATSAYEIQQGDDTVAKLRRRSTEGLLALPRHIFQQIRHHQWVWYTVRRLTYVITPSL